MTNNEEFLARWSRRKREAKEAGEAEPQPAEPVEAQNSVPSDAPAAEPAGLDLSRPPPIDSIDATTDIAAFLREGIPQELSRAALRRAWTADPVIRDFVGLAENAWDFNDPNAMPGFGPLDCSQAELSGVVDRIVGGARQAAASLPGRPEADDVERSTDRESGPEPDSAPPEAIADLGTPDAGTTPDVQPASAAPHSDSGERVEHEETSVRRRTHGGALPR